MASDGNPSRGFQEPIEWDTIRNGSIFFDAAQGAGSFEPPILKPLG
jgi:hypothetical protein